MRIMKSDIYEAHFVTLDSVSLKDNLLGDPTQRTTVVLSPQDIPPDEPLPMIWVLTGYTGRGIAYLNHNPWQENFLDRLTRLTHQGMRPIRAVLPDCFTKLGGSQYLDSPVTGPYATYLWDELRPQIESRFAVSARAVVGKSSGGFGALISVIMRPKLFQALASHSGDMFFEWSYLPDFPKAYQIIDSQGGIGPFIEAFLKRDDKPSSWISAMNIICLAAVYSPNLSKRDFPADFPLRFDTLEMDKEVWQKWIAWDPLRLVDQVPVQNTLSSLQVLYFDAGRFDEFQLQYGATQLHQKLVTYQISHQYELYDGNHFRTNHRFDHSLPLIANALWTLRT